MHYKCCKGKKALIKLKDGTHFVDHFEERKSTYYVLRERGRVNVSTVAFFTIFTHQPEVDRS